MNQSTYRILFEGERWLGSDAGGCLRALRRMDQAVVDLDCNTIVPSWRSLPLRLCRRLMLPLLIQEYNGKLLELAREFKPEIFLAFKGTNVLPATLQEMKRQGIALYNYYPDVSAFIHTVQWLPRALQVYHCVFSTKSFLASDLAEHGFPLQRWELLPHGYDPEAHYPVAVAPDEQSRYGADVTFIGTYQPGKAKLLAELTRLLPGLDLAAWGNEWHSVAAPELKPCLRGRPLYGVEYTKAICASKIMLGLLIEKQKGASSGDLVTSRSFNIPACGAFMIHQRTEEILHYYQEGREIECYGSTEELAEKIQFYLAHPEARQAVAQAGYRRCVPAYSLEQRVQRILSWHAAQSPA